MNPPQCAHCGDSFKLTEDGCTWEWWPTCAYSDEDHIQAYVPEVLTKSQAVKRLREIAEGKYGQYDMKHLLADRLLLDLIGYPEITKAFTAVGRWYS